MDADQTDGAGKNVDSQQWEYLAKAVDVSMSPKVVGKDGDIDDIWHMQEWLDRLAKDGWELDEMTSMPRKLPGYKVIMVFRRPALQQ